jgi:hypothetical protein
MHEPTHRVARELQLPKGAGAGAGAGESAGSDVEEEECPICFDLLVDPLSP